MLTFHNLEVKFGAASAYQCLQEIEKAAHLQSWKLVELDPEVRLEQAIQAQDAMRVMSVAA